MPGAADDGAASDGDAVSMESEETLIGIDGLEEQWALLQDAGQQHVRGDSSSGNVAASPDGPTSREAGVSSDGPTHGDVPSADPTRADAPASSSDPRPSAGHDPAPTAEPASSSRGTAREGYIVQWVDGRRVELPEAPFSNPENRAQDPIEYMAGQTGFLIAYVDGMRVELPMEAFQNIPLPIQHDVSRHMRQWCNAKAAELGMSRSGLEAIIGYKKRDRGGTRKWYQ